MSSIITSILSSTVGLLWNKARDTTAEKLKNGDVTDAQIRKIVVRELSEIKSKIEGLSLKDLESSSSYLQEGVDILNASLDESKTEQNSLLNKAQDDKAEIPSVSRDGDSPFLNEAMELSDTLKRVKINSGAEFESAKKRFFEARKSATEAFSNNGLDIQYRILAAKLRVVSEILEQLENPETAIIGCLSFLKKLHSLPDIRETFSNYLKGGVRSWFYKEERIENVKSVMLINQVLFKLNLKFCSKYYSAYAWPTIEVAGRSFYPILHWQEVSKRKEMAELIQPPNELILDDETIDPYYTTTNGLGEIIVAYDDKIKMISRKFESKVCNLPDPGDGETIELYARGIAVDNSNNVYLVRWVETCKENVYMKRYVLNVLDENYNVKRECVLDFLDAADSHDINIAVNENNEIIMIKGDDLHLYVCDITGKLKRKFKRESTWVWVLGVSKNKEVMMSSMDGRAVHVVDTEKKNIKSRIPLPRDHIVCGVEFYHIIGKIIVLTYNIKEESYFLLCYSETFELEISTVFCKRMENRFTPRLTAHPGAHVAVGRSRSITFI